MYILYKRRIVQYLIILHVSISTRS